MKIAICSDHLGFRYKTAILKALKESEYEIHDLGVHTNDQVDYPTTVRPLAEAIRKGKYDRGIVIGSSGNGEAIVANRTRDIRCAVCWNIETAVLAAKNYDANILALGERLISEDVALECVWAWMKTPFSGGDYLRQLNLIDGRSFESEEGGDDQHIGRGALQNVSKATEPGTKRPVPDKWDVFISFRYIRYYEGDFYLDFQMDPALKGPSIINIPSEEEWKSEFPDWARDRRDEILDRLKSKCSHLDYELKE